MDEDIGLQLALRIEDVPTVRSMVAQKLREAIMSGTFKPGQRLVERELCEMTGVSRPSIREAPPRQRTRRAADVLCQGSRAKQPWMWSLTSPALCIMA